MITDEITEEITDEIIEVKTKHNRYTVINL